MIMHGFYRLRIVLTSKSLPPNISRLYFAISFKFAFFFTFFIQSDIFNLPLPALWTAVLGEYNRNKESGHERRVSIEKIITHSRYSHFDHDIGK